MTRPLTAAAFAKKHSAAICVYLETTTPWETPRKINPKTQLAHPTSRMMLDATLTDRVNGDWTIRTRIQKRRPLQFHIQLVHDADLITLQKLFSIGQAHSEDTGCRNCFSGLYESADYWRLGVMLDIFDAPPKLDRKPL